VEGRISEEMAALTWAGIGIVFAVLALIAFVISVIKRLDDRWQAAEAKADAKAVLKPATIDETTLVLISAAAAVAVGGRFRVRRIRRLLSPKTKRTPWSAQGRLILQGSHAPSRQRDLR